MNALDMFVCTMYMQLHTTGERTTTYGDMCRTADFILDNMYKKYGRSFFSYSTDPAQRLELAKKYPEKIGVSSGNGYILSLKDENITGINIMGAFGRNDIPKEIIDIINEKIEKYREAQSNAERTN